MNFIVNILEGIFMTIWLVFCTITKQDRNEAVDFHKTGHFVGIFVFIFFVVVMIFGFLKQF